VADDLETPAVPVPAEPALNITFTTPLKEPYLRRFVRDALRPASLTAICASLCMVLISAVCFYIGGPAVFPGLMNLAVAFVFLQSMGFPADRYMRSIPAFAYGPREFVISDSEVTINSAPSSTRMTWETITRVKQRPYAFALYMYNRNVCDVPRAPMTDEQDEQLRQFLVGRGLLRAARNGGAERDDE